MSKIYAGSDGSFMSAWQAWKRRNHEYESFVMCHRETTVFRTTDQESDEEFVWYHGIEKTDFLTV
jgi:hypothetical protein